MPHQMTLMFLNIALTLVLAVSCYLHLDGGRWWFPCLWFVGMAAGSLWDALPHRRAAEFARRTGGRPAWQG